MHTSHRTTASPTSSPLQHWNRLALWLQHHVSDSMLSLVARLAIAAVFFYSRFCWSSGSLRGYQPWPFWA